MKNFRIIFEGMSIDYDKNYNFMIAGKRIFFMLFLIIL